MFKKIIFPVLFLVLISFNALSLDRSIKPEPGPAPAIELGEYHTFQLENGLTVFVVENHRLPRVTFNLVLDNDPIMEGEKKGYTSVTGDLLESRTANMTRDELNKAIDFLGASVSFSSNGFYATSLSHFGEDLLKILSDMLLNPHFTQEEFDRIINRRKSALATERDDPSQIASKIRRSLNYKGHPYAEITTEETLSNIKLDDCREYFETYFRPNAGYLAIVGDVEVDEVRNLLEKYFGAWEPAEVPSHEHQTPAPPEQRQVAINDRPHATQTALQITHPINLRPGDEDVIAAQVANTILGGGFFRLNDNLRETHAYTYGAFSSLSTDPQVGHFTIFADVRTQVTDSSVYQILYELDRIRNEKVPENELRRVINYRTGNFSISLEDPQVIARFALNTARYDLPEDYYQNYLKNLDAITADDVQSVAQKYILPDEIYIVAVGVADDIADGLQQFTEAELRYFDREGKEMEPPRHSDIPEGLTAEDVIQKYIDAIGGRKNLKKIESMSVFSSTEIQGMTLSMEKHYQKPAQVHQSVKMGDNIMNLVVINNNQGFSLQGGARIPLEKTELKENLLDGKPVQELYYDQFDVKTELTGIRQVNGKEAYVIKVVKPGGEERSAYYDLNTGLKIKETGVFETPQGDMQVEISYSNYQEVEDIPLSGLFNRIFGRTVQGVKFPYTLEQSMGPQSFLMTVDEMKFNHEQDPELFEVDIEESTR